ncbi:MAG: aminopeptidase, partial [Myxococcales bacterium]|nr:aminopeptidase [Myxococcales bacterium]
ALTAASRDRLEALTWWFPIVGRVPYLGFFDKDDGIARRDKLAAEGYDTELRGVPAFSTLGWFADPIFSSMLTLPDTVLVNTIIHELTHATLFVPGDVEFNENLATFVGNRGAVDFFVERDGPASPRARRVLDDQADAQRFGAFMRRMIDGLTAYYASGASREEKIAGREREFDHWRRRFTTEVVPELRGDRYGGFADASLNNAVILSLGAYYRDLGLFDRAYEVCGRDLPRLVRALVGLARAQKGAMAAGLEKDVESGALCSSGP